MSDVCAHTPVEDGRIVKEAVYAYAISRKQTGDPRRIGVLRAEALTQWASDYLTGRSGTAVTAVRRPADRSRDRRGCSRRPSAATRCLRRSLGYGLVPREVVAKMIAVEAAKLRLLVVDGRRRRLVHRANDGYRPTPAQIAQVRATWVTSAGPGSQVHANRCDVDHAVPYPEGPTSDENLIAPDRTWHVGKTRKMLSVTINPDGSARWNTALGQSRTVTPYDYLLSDDTEGS